VRTNYSILTLGAPVVQDADGWMSIDGTVHRWFRWSTMRNQYLPAMATWRRRGSPSAAMFIVSRIAAGVHCKNEFAHWLNREGGWLWLASSAAKQVYLRAVIFWKSVAKTIQPLPRYD